MEASFEDFEYLARSEHRVRVLRELSRESCDRRDLEAATGASRATLGRILGSFEERGWITRSGTDYETTAVGDLVAADVDALFETLDAARTLGDVVEWLPTDAMTVDLRAFADATIVRATETDTGAPMRHYVDRLEAASRLRVLLYGVDATGIETIHDRVTGDGPFDSEAVLSPAAVKTVQEVDRMRIRLRDAVRRDHDVYRSPVRPRHHFAIVDDTVCLFLVDDRGLQGLVESTHEAVREWAADTYAAHRADAERLGPDAFEAPAE